MKLGPALLYFALIGSTASAQDVRIGVLGLFHSFDLTVSSTTGSAIILRADDRSLTLDARSYFVAGRRRHEDFDFCDTTHCQFLRSPPPSQSAAFKAAAATQGLALTFESQVFATMYTRSCSGRTSTPVENGLPPGNYPYYSVECHYCRQHPVRWQSRISAQNANNLRPSNEPSR